MTSSAGSRPSKSGDPKLPKSKAAPKALRGNVMKNSTKASQSSGRVSVSRDSIRSLSPTQSPNLPHAWARLLAGTLSGALIFAPVAGEAFAAGKVDAFGLPILPSSSSEVAPGDKVKETKPDKSLSGADSAVARPRSKRDTTSANVTGASENTSSDRVEAQGEGEGEEEAAAKVVGGETTASSQIYLSDLSYLPGTSKTAWKQITYNRNLDGGAIGLLVNGEKVSFGQGITAHAEAIVDYDISSYRQRYPYFSAYLGVDAAQNGKGNGATLEIFGSTDNKQWKSLAKTSKLTSKQDAQLVQVKISDYSYLRLRAYSHGSNAGDHTVFADAKLSVGQRTQATFPSLNELDQQIKALVDQGVSPAEVSEQGMKWAAGSTQQQQKLTHLIWQRALVNKVGAQSLAILKQNPDYAGALDKLWNDPLLTYNFMAWDNVDQAGSVFSALQAFVRIQNKYPEPLAKADENHFYLRLALAVAHAFGRQPLVEFWEKPAKSPLPEDRFAIYASLVESKIFDYAGEAFKPGDSATLPRLGTGQLPEPKFELPDTLQNLTVGAKTPSGDEKLADSTSRYRWSTRQFVDLPLPLMKWVVDARMNNDEIAWLRDYAWSKYSNDRGKMFNAYSYIRYTMGYNYGKDEYYATDKQKQWEEKYNFQNYFSDYSTSTRRLWRVFEDGAVCGGLAKTYANLAEVFGRPSAVVAQPGHAATISYYWDNKSQRYRWEIDNNISGWAGSNNEYDYKLLNWGNNTKGEAWTAGSYTTMATDAINQPDQLLAANTYLALSDALAGSDKLADQTLQLQEKQLRLALEKLPYHEAAWRKLVDLYELKKTTSKDWNDLAEAELQSFAAYPLALNNHLKRTTRHITDETMKAALEIRKDSALKAAANATGKNSSQPEVTKAIANWLLGEEKSQFAEFSFDGENAGQIVIDPAYNDSSIRVRYSLDQGKTWIETDQHRIQLTAEQIAQISPETDLLVGLVGTDTYYCIDILGPKAVNLAKLGLNDYENWLRGDLEGLEWRVKGNGSISGEGAANASRDRSANQTETNPQAGEVDPSTESGAKKAEVSGEGQPASSASSSAWVRYTPDTRFPGNQTIQVRYGATGLHVAGEAKELKFTANSETPTEQYVSVTHLGLKEFSSQQSEGAGHAAKNSIDGNPLTAWHTRFSAAVGQDGKFLTLELDQPRYISAIEYTPGGGRNGRAKKVQVLVSVDGQSWTTAAEASLANNANAKRISFTARPAKLIKVVATETYGNTNAELNKYFSGRMLAVFEDTTLAAARREAKIQYSAAQPSAGPVRATLVLPEGATSETTEHLFNENGQHVFTFRTDLGEEKTITAEVNWIVSAQTEEGSGPETAAADQVSGDLAGKEGLADKGEVEAEGALEGEGALAGENNAGVEAADSDELEPGTHSAVEEGEIAPESASTLATGSVSEAASLTGAAPDTADAAGLGSENETAAGSQPAEVSVSDTNSSGVSSNDSGTDSTLVSPVTEENTGESAADSNPGADNGQEGLADQAAEEAENSATVTEVKPALGADAKEDEEPEPAEASVADAPDAPSQPYPVIIPEEAVAAKETAPVEAGMDPGSETEADQGEAYPAAEIETVPAETVNTDSDSTTQGNVGATEAQDVEEAAGEGESVPSALGENTAATPAPTVEPIVEPDAENTVPNAAGPEPEPEAEPAEDSVLPSREETVSLTPERPELGTGIQPEPKAEATLVESLYSARTSVVTGSNEAEVQPASGLEVSVSTLESASVGGSNSRASTPRRTTRSTRSENTPEVALVPGSLPSAAASTDQKVESASPEIPAPSTEATPDQGSESLSEPKVLSQGAGSEEPRKSESNGGGKWVPIAGATGLATLLGGGMIGATQGWFKRPRWLRYLKGGK